MHDIRLLEHGTAGPLSSDEMTLLQTPRTSRMPGMIEARNDLEAVGSWLAQYRDRPNTLAAYTRESRRLLLWCARERRKPLHALMLEDYLAYEAFLKDPPEHWVGPRRPADHPQWRALQRPLSVDSANQAMTILGSLTRFLCDARYLSGNPLALTRRARRGQSAVRGADRALTPIMLQAIHDSLRDRAASTQIKRHRLARDRVVVALGLYAGLRISEIVWLRECDVRERHVGGVTGWWLLIRGKGDKQAWVPLAAPVLRAIRRYRGVMALPADTGRYNQRPLIRSIYDSTAPLERSTLYRDLKAVYREAADCIDDPATQRDLQQATPHSLRHTFATHLVDSGVPLTHVRALMRHSSINTTMIYTSDRDRDLVAMVHAHLDDWYVAA